VQLTLLYLPQLMPRHSATLVLWMPCN